MKKIFPILLVMVLTVLSYPAWSNEETTNAIKIKYDYNSQDMFDNSSAKISSIIKSKTKDISSQFHSLYRRDQASIEFLEDGYSFIFSTAVDTRILFGRNKFQSASFHLVDTITWLPWIKIQLQVNQMFDALSSNPNLTLKTKNGRTIYDPVKFENLQQLISLRWHSNSFSTQIAVERSTLPKSVLPRDEDLYRATIYVTSKINPIYIKKKS